jgi:3-hydroxybutyrate dehydrogenase
MNIPVQAQSFEIRQPLSGKLALITGSTSGIGLGIARALAGAGSHIVLNGFATPEQVAELQKGMTADYRVRVSYSGADLSKADAVQKMMEETLRSMGTVDILVNNAGIQHVAPLQEFPTEKWDAILALNLSAAFHTTRLALPSMIANKWGRIINVASAHGLVASPYKSAYVAAKHGIVGLT